MGMFTRKGNVMRRNKRWNWAKRPCLLLFFRLFEQNRGLEGIVADIAILYEDPPSRASIYSRLKHNVLRGQLEKLVDPERVDAAYENYRARMDIGPKPVTLSKSEMVLKWLCPLTPAEADDVRYWQQATRSFA